MQQTFKNLKTTMFQICSFNFDDFRAPIDQTKTQLNTIENTQNQMFEKIERTNTACRYGVFVRSKYF
ncbi:hypothetical protein BpHYR1_013687 [Brachionus plicatilis]|uniref:Uncharacterized protein n=1 Tax=Brachionus plicatilis TaxID=10195 RepID=A0A3M7RTH9_BRAPC|nr:hypothetical protein BpHYR1_013687 [Brachionus plicatilis]